MSEPKTNSTAVAGSSPVPCSPSSDARFIAEAKKWCEELGSLSDGEIVCKLADLLAQKFAAERLLEWHRGRIEMLGREQKRMRDPERTLVCDILANGQLLPDPKGARYGNLPENVQVDLPPKAGGDSTNDAIGG